MNRHKRYRFRPERDKGTDELRRHRISLSGNQDVPHDYPLDVLHARNLITESQAKAGQRLAYLRWVVWGPPRGWTATSDLYAKMVAQVDGRGPRAEPGSRADIDRARRYDDALSTLKASGPYPLHYVMSVAVYIDRHGTLASWELSALRTGLNALAQHFGFEVARAA